MVTYNEIPPGAYEKKSYIARVVSSDGGEVLQEGDKVIYEDEGRRFWTLN